MTKVYKRIPGVSFQNNHLGDLGCADNTNLLRNLISQLRDALTMYQEESAKLGLQVSWMKTQLMHVGDGSDPPPLLIGPDAVELSQLTYLPGLNSHQ